MRISVILLLVINYSFAQNADRPLFGKIVSDGRPVAGVDIVNLVNEKSVLTDQKGEFRIAASEDDLLIISHPEYEYLRHSVDATDFEETPMVITLTKKAIELEETVVNAYAHINAVSLGILSKPAKSYTPAERRLYGAQSGPLDAVLNMLSGKTDMLKKEVEVEKKERLLERLSKLFEDDTYYVENLKIAPDRVSAFKYFAADDLELAKVIHEKNLDLIKFHLGRVAESFLDQNR